MMVAFWPPRMVTQEQAGEIKVLARRGVSAPEATRQLGYTSHTIRRYLMRPMPNGTRPARRTQSSRIVNRF